MTRDRRKLYRVSQYILACAVLSWVSWAAFVGGWREDPVPRNSPRAVTTIVAYSEEMMAEMDRPTPVACDTLPASPKITYYNRTWIRGMESSQSWQHVPDERVSLYAAYYDQRLPQHYIRILATFKGKKISPDEVLYCQTRPQNPLELSIEVVAAKPLEIWWHEWDPNSIDVDTPLLLSCPLTEPLPVPSIVSIVTQPCDDPINGFYLNPYKNTSYERNFTICVKDMTFQKDISHNLIEWIEINKILGAEKIDIYVENISKQMEDVLEYYRNKNLVRIFQIPISSNNRSLWQRRRDHIITYNDCLYRNIHKSKFIIPIDVDEIILPRVAINWSDLIKRLEINGWNSSNNSGILIKNVFFFDFMQGVGKYKYIREHVNKSNIYIQRDDVRLENSANLVHSIDNEVIDSKVDYDISEEIDKYKTKCATKMVTPRLVKNLARSALVSPVGQYSKSMMLTRRVLTAFNHYPLAGLGATDFAGWEAPLSEVQLNHYKEECNSRIMDDCARYRRRSRIDTSALRLRGPLLRALAEGLCIPPANKTDMK